MTTIHLPESDGGYRPCACRDCMEIAIGQPGALCSACEEAGCEASCPCPNCEGSGSECKVEPEPEDDQEPE